MSYEVVLRVELDEDPGYDALQYLLETGRIEDAQILFEGYVDPEYVYRVVDDNGNFAKPRNTGYRAPDRTKNEARWSQAKGFYLTAGRAKAALRGGIGKSVQRARVFRWEAVE